MVSILTVVVLYRTTFADSKTLAGLVRAFADDPALMQDFDVFVWDNSPDPIAMRDLPFSFTYHHATANSGVAGAYNSAAAVAHERGLAWLLLLDSDTSVTAEFLRGMTHHAAANATEHDIAAVTPFLYDGELCLSPRRWRFARHAPLLRSAQPYTERNRMFAANSGTLVRVAALQAIGGYSPRFWLDYSDIYVFHRFHEAGFVVRIACDLALQHEIAMVDYDTRMRPERYAIYLQAEGDFLDMHRGFLERLAHVPRLAVRVFRQRRYADPTFSRMTREALWRRLHTTRLQRMREAGQM